MKALRENFNGIITCLFELVIGILLLINPMGFTTGIIMTAGGILILIGVINCIKYFTTELREATKGQYLTKGLIAVLSGAFCVLNTEWFLVTFPALTVIYGVAVLLAAVEKVQLCMDLLRLKRKKWYLAAISSVISIICAVIILKNPFSSVEITWIIAGVSLILEAVFDMYILMANSKTRIEDKEKEETDKNNINEDSEITSEELIKE